MTTTYVYDSQEYVLTGRSAKRTLKSGKDVTMHEIRPVTIKDPKDLSFNKWVEQTELYVVSGEIMDE